MEAAMDSDKPSESQKQEVKSTWLLSYGLFFTGLFFVLLSVLGSEVWKWPVWLSAFVRDVGLLLSAVMAGSLLHERFLRDEMVRFTGEEVARRLDSKIPEVEVSALLTARAVHQLFKESPPEMTGLRLVAQRRRNFSGYYRWVNERTPQDLFFAGRSVLHRIDADIKANTANSNSSAEGVILRRLKEGSKVRILFLDPRTDIMERLASEEGQRLEAMLGDVSTSLQICRRLNDLLAQEPAPLSPGAELTIRVYNRVPYFAYHRQDNDVIVGFYFSSGIGSSSAAYEAIDEDTKRQFGAHFERLLSDASRSTLLEYDGARGRSDFNQKLFDDLCAACKKKPTKIAGTRRPLEVAKEGGLTQSGTASR